MLQSLDPSLLCRGTHAGNERSGSSFSGCTDILQADGTHIVGSGGVYIGVALFWETIIYLAFCCNPESIQRYEEVFCN